MVDDVMSRTRTAISALIRKYRADNGLSMAALSRKTGLSITTLWRIERRGASLKYPKRKMIADGIGMTLVEFNRLIEGE